MEAARKYLEDRKIYPKSTIIVGIVDSGIDTLTTDITPALWNNPKEKRDGRDNDKNGYVDDMHGWNFLGTSDGSFNMTSAGTEEYREFKRLYPKFKNIGQDGKVPAADSAEYAYYLDMRKKAGIEKYLKYAAYVAQKGTAYDYMDSVVTSKLGSGADTLTVAGINCLAVDDERWIQSCQMIMADMFKAGQEATWKSMLDNYNKGLALIQSRIDGIEHAEDKRLLMGDDLNDAKDRGYGNPILEADGCDHGTFVSSIIAGQGVADPGVKGIFPEARLMIIRAVPDGDEYDKDVASSIYYAVENGANVINLSLGKYTSTNPNMVNKAIEYARKKNVLLIQASGNSSKNIDTIPYFPTARDRKGRRYDNFIRVGASDKLGRPVGFSNFGAENVDVLAPGSDIVAVMPGNEVSAQEGTSVAAPVVTGVAAMLMAYFPKLKAQDVRDIIIKSARRSKDTDLQCLSGGVVDALQAVKMAESYRR